MSMLTFPQHPPTYSPIGSEGAQTSTSLESWSTIINIDGRGFAANFSLRGIGTGTSSASAGVRISVDGILVYSGSISGGGGFFAGESLGIIQSSDIIPGWSNDATIAKVPLPVNSAPIRMGGAFPILSTDRMAMITSHLFFNSSLLIEATVYGGSPASYPWAFSGGVA